MRGKCNRLQALVLNVCLYAYYICCLIRTSFGVDIIGRIKRIYYRSYFFTKSMYIVNLVRVSCHHKEELRVPCEYVIQAVKKTPKQTLKNTRIFHSKLSLRVKSPTGPTLLLFNLDSKHIGSCEGHMEITVALEKAKPATTKLHFFFNCLI